jgi:hypothetical protein
MQWKYGTHWKAVLVVCLAEPRCSVHAIKLLKPMRFRGKFNAEFQWLGLATTPYLDCCQACLALIIPTTVLVLSRELSVQVRAWWTAHRIHETAGTFRAPDITCQSDNLFVAGYVLRRKDTYGWHHAWQRISPPSTNFLPFCSFFIPPLSLSSSIFYSTAPFFSQSLWPWWILYNSSCSGGC